ncbi:MAG TPA: deoxyhypusine synthase [archaeon]|nr:deoxyhypusine synthase [archaeon]
MKPVKDFDIKSTDSEELIKQMKESGGFTAKKLGVATDIIKEMVTDKNAVNFLSFPADIIATGTRGVIKEMIKRKWFSIVITTCGTLDHDIARSYKDYYHGEFEMDDAELHKKDIHRLGNVLVPIDSYGMILEEKVGQFLKEIYEEGKRELATYELCWEFGKRISNENSILHWCWKNKIPMIIPGITDGSIGYQIWMFRQKHKDFKIDVFKDEQLLSDTVWNTKKSNALIMGGGISKHHVIWHSQFSGGLDRAVYLTTAQEYDGSLSGAQTREAISWGKLKENASHTNVYGDVTILLPIIFSALSKQIK